MSMTMCPNCEYYYDESEEPYCPNCHDGEPEDYYGYIESDDDED